MRRVLSVTAGVVLLLGLGASSALAAQETKPPAVSHELEGRDQCLMCHSGAMEGMPAAPASHEGWKNNACLWCHGADAAMQTKQAPAIPHELEGRDNCEMCHSGAMEGMPAMPEDHKGRKSGDCKMCHAAGA